MTTKTTGQTDDSKKEYKHDLDILESLRRIMRAVDIHSRQLKQKYNITAPQLVCLLTIIDKQMITVAKLAREIHLSPSTVVGILDRLEEKGLISRERDDKDRRVVKVTATAKGVEFSKSAPSPLQDKLGNSLNQLSDLEQLTISVSLRRIVELMEAEEIDAAPILQAGHIEESLNK